MGGRQISVIPSLLNTATQGVGFTIKKIYIYIYIFFFTVSQLSPRATNTPSLGASVKAPGSSVPQIRKCHFFSDPCVFGYSL